jgi:hypothetical protein
MTMHAKRVEACGTAQTAQVCSAPRGEAAVREVAAPLRHGLDGPPTNRMGVDIFNAINELQF